MATRRARNLTDADIQQIVEILDGWTGKLTWNLLIDAIALRLHSRYTRQALHKHERIRHAFELVKNSPAVKGKAKERAASPEMQVALERIAWLEAENTRLKAENERLLEQFVIWAYNAYTRGIDEKTLNRPLPPVNRGRTPSRVGTE